LPNTQETGENETVRRMMKPFFVYCLFI